MANKYVDSDGLLYFWQKIKNTFAKVSDVPTKTSDLTNDSGYITSADVPEGSTASTTTPLMDGTAATGTETAFARGDHRHPTDTSRAASSHTHGNITNAGALQTTDISIASGDKLVVTDASNSNKVARTSVSFDGSTSTQCLTKAGSFASFNNYTHPSYTSKTSGLYKITVDSTGHVSGTASVAASDLPDLSGTYVAASLIGAASGVCPLNSSSKIDSTYLPSYVDDVIEAYPRSGQTALSQNWLATGSASGTVISPEAGKIYILMTNYANNDLTINYAANTQFRWSGTAYVKMLDGGMSPITNSEIDTIVAS